MGNNRVRGGRYLPVSYREEELHTVHAEYTLYYIMELIDTTKSFVPSRSNRRLKGLALSIAVILLFPLYPYEAKAQEHGPVPFYISCELSSKYVWRGLEYGKAPTLFPAINYERGTFLATASGAYAIDGSHQEIDLALNYCFNNLLTLSLNDYYFASASGQDDSYFHFRNADTQHYVEAYATIEPSTLPLWVKLSSYIYGADKDSTGKQAYSSYAELGYSYKFKDENRLALALGANLNKSFYTDYLKGFNVVNITLKYETCFTFNRFNIASCAAFSSVS